MGATQQMLIVGGASTNVTKAAGRNDALTGTNTYTNTTYTNLLNVTTGGGTARQITFNKLSATSRLIVSSGALFQFASTTNKVTLGVTPDGGTTDYDILQGSQGGTATGAYVGLEGDVEISGLAAGTVTLTGRIKVDTSSASIGQGGGANYFLHAIEVEP